MTIDEGNVLIARFMGAKQCPKGTSNLKYHTSWDWLMPVIEKINKTIVDGVGAVDVIIYRSGCQINDPREIIVETASNGSLIACVHSAVVEFLQTYKPKA